MLHNEYEKLAHRPLTYAERKVNLLAIKKMQESLWAELDGYLLKIKDKILSWENIDDFVDEIVVRATEIQKKAFDFWKQTASAEMKIRVKPTNKKVEGIMYQQNYATILDMVDQIKKKIDAEVKEYSELGIISSFLNWLKSLFVFGAINLWRETVFEDNPEMVYAFQYSAILDDRTTDLCNDLDWVIVRPQSPEYYEISPPNHRSCRGIWAEILMDEPYKPSFTRDPKQWHDDDISTPSIWDEPDFLKKDIIDAENQ